MHADDTSESGSDVGFSLPRQAAAINCRTIRSPCPHGPTLPYLPTGAEASEATKERMLHVVEQYKSYVLDALTAGYWDESEKESELIFLQACLSAFCDETDRASPLED